MAAEQWLLPDGVEELMPAQAQALESLRRKLLDMYGRWGYDIVYPPLLEFLDSLLQGTSNDLALQTFTVTDQLSGRLMGFRADITPQVARLDAHENVRQGPARYCYASTVLHTKPANLNASRIPLQVGVELFGYAGWQADAEVVSLMLATLKAADVPTVHLDLGHVGICEGLADAANINDAQREELFGIFKRKSAAELSSFVQENINDAIVSKQLLALLELAGDASVLVQAKSVLEGAPEKVQKALVELEAVSANIQSAFPELDLYFDLGETRGYRYHTGCVFAAYVAGCGRAVAQGGRYDHVAEVYGRARPATGFSVDLKTLLQWTGADEALASGIYAPGLSDAALQQLIVDMRDQGERVVAGLPGIEPDFNELACDRIFEQQADGCWVVQKI